MSDAIDDFLGPEPSNKRATKSSADPIDDFLGGSKSAEAKAQPSPAPATADAPAWYSPSELGRHAAGALASVARGAAEGVEGLGAMQRLGLNALGVPPIDATTLEVMRRMPGAGLAAAGLSPAVVAPNLPQAEREGEAKLLAPAGLDPSYLDPKNGLDRFTYAAGRGLGGALPLLLATPSGAAAGLAVGGATGGTGAEIGKDVTPGSSVGPIVGGVVGGGLGQGAVSAAERAMALGLPEIASRMGTAGTMEEAGTHLQNAGTKFLTEDHKALQSQAWAPIDEAIDPNTPVGINGFKGAISNITKDFGPLQKVAQTIGGGAVKGQDLLKHVDAITDPDVGVGPTWQQLANLRTYLGDNLSNARVNVDIPTQQMKQLYAGLTSDMRTAAHGQGVGEAFDEANQQSQRLFDTADRVAALTKTGTDKPSVGPAAPAKVAEALVRGARSGGADLEALRAAHPDLDSAVNELAAAHLTPSEQGTGLPAFHKLSLEGQAALLPYGKLRDQAVAASERAAAPKAADITNTAVFGLLGGEVGRYAADAMGVSPATMGALGLAGAVAPFAIRNSKALAARPLSLAAPVAGGAEGYEDSLPDLVVRPKARTGG